MHTFPLPPAIAHLLEARNKVRSHYEEILRAQGSQVELKFTLAATWWATSAKPLRQSFLASG